MICLFVNLTKGQLSWLGLSQLDASLSHLEGGNLSGEKASIRSSCRALFQWVVPSWIGGPGFSPPHVALVMVFITN